MRKYILIAIVLISGYFIINYFYDRNVLILNKTTFSDIDEIDTVDSYPDKGLYVLQLVRRGTFGRFSLYIGISKHDKLNPKRIVNYEVKNSNDIRHPWRISKDYFAFIKEFEGLNYGWFEIKKGKLISQQQMSAAFEDTMKLNPTNLDYYLYKYNNGTLQSISDKPDDILKQKDGLFYIPSPGIGVINLFSKKEIFNIIDSSFSLKEIPDKIRISPLKLQSYIH